MKCLRTCLTLMLLSAPYPLFISCARAEPHNLVGQWQVKFTFSGGEEHSLRFEAQADSKATFLLLDSRSSLLPPAEPTKAEWEHAASGQVMFSGELEFPIGNVGREVGTLVCRGAFDGANSLVGEAAFFSVGQDPKDPATKPAKTGKFTARRSGTDSGRSPVQPTGASLRPVTPW
jgi:hypothetical protein